MYKRDGGISQAKYMNNEYGWNVPYDIENRRNGRKQLNKIKLNVLLLPVTLFELHVCQFCLRQ
jgi:hypothetical protein